MAKGPGTLVDAGFVDKQGKITSKAKEKFIEDVKKELREGSGGAQFDTGISVNPNPSFDAKLEDEKTYAAFHKNSFTNYEKIAEIINQPSNFTLLPNMADPVAVATTINPNVNINLDLMKGDFIPFFTPPLIPQLAVILKIPVTEIPQFTVDLTNLVKLPPPLPTADISQLELPDIKEFSALYEFKLPALSIPKIFPDLISKVPSIGMKLVSGNIMGAISQVSLTLIEKAFKLPEIPPSGPSDIAMKIAVTNVTVRMTSAMSLATTVGITLGSSPSGIVGGIGRFWGVK